MRKFLLGLLIILLLVALGFMIIRGIPGLDSISTYSDIEEAYRDYEATLKILENKNKIDLPAVLKKLDNEYSDSDTDNVIKKYNDNKSSYEYYLALQKANEMIDQADIYDIEYIWTSLGEFAKKSHVNLTIDPEKSEADLESEDYIMCNLNFVLVGEYQNVVTCIEKIETDPSMGFQINDFYATAYNSKAINQNDEKNMDTDNIPNEGGSSSNSSEEFSVTSSDSNDSNHLLDIKVKFKVYNVPINRRTVTNVKPNASSSKNDSSDEENDEESSDYESEEY